MLARDKKGAIYHVLAHARRIINLLIGPVTAPKALDTV